MNTARGRAILDRIRRIAERAERLQARATGIAAQAARLDGELTDWTEHEQRAKAAERAQCAVENELTAWEKRF